MGLGDQRETDGAGKVRYAIWFILHAMAWCLVIAIRLIMRAVLNVCAITIGFVIGFLVVTRLRR
jgi:hypothetical protein